MLYDVGSTVTDFIVQGSNFAFCLTTPVSNPAVGCIYNYDQGSFPAAAALSFFADFNPVYIDNSACYFPQHKTSHMCTHIHTL